MFLYRRNISIQEKNTHWSLVYTHTCLVLQVTAKAREEEAKRHQTLLASIASLEAKVKEGEQTKAVTEETGGTDEMAEQLAQALQKIQDLEGPQKESNQPAQNAKPGDQDDDDDESEDEADPDKFLQTVDGKTAP